ncbi:MAG: large conductance mechanosensitive channel protein MscL [Clostridia bacterium]|nr:large conductance mechanosensitive channel protein MscL [Clostridia bacterium]
MKTLMREFKAFALRGNVMDLAVGVIIGAAFKAIVDSLVQDILSPIIGVFTRQDFSTLSLNIFGIDIHYGAFITAVINFIIMAFIIFLLVKGMNRLAQFNHSKEQKEEAPATKKCPYCCSEVNISATRCPYCTSQLEA